MKPNWLNRDEYPFTSHYFKVDNQHLHYIDEGPGSNPGGQTILFVHGTPSWSFDYRHLIKALSKTHRCIAIDHIGFGLSDKPEEYDYSTQNHSLTLEKFVKEMKLENITLVVHDFGGPIGLNFALKYPEKIKRIIAFNTWMWSSVGEPEYEKFKKILKSPLLPFLYKRLNFSPRFILPASFGDKKLDKKLRIQYTSPFENASQRNGALAFARSLLNDQSWFESLWQKREILEDKPMLFIWGMKDKVITPRNLEKFRSAYPHATAVELPTCGHFPQEEEHKKSIESILGFCQK